MPPTFINANRRLVMRYSSGTPFSFDHIRLTAGDQGVFDLAGALASIQDEPPQRISTVVTRQLL
jgi:hypothetical protein